MFYGGLGYQLEHHLFPTISYSRLDAVALLTKRACAEFGVPYFYYPTIWGALVAHARFIARMSRAEPLAGAGAADDIVKKTV